MKGRRVIVTRLDTGESWPSIRAAARGLYVSKTSLEKARKLGCKCACGIPVKFEEDMTLSGHNGGIRKPIKRMDTGEVFEDGPAAAKALGCAPNGVYTALRRKRPCKGVWLRRI